MAVAMALVALLKAAELALLTDCTLPPWELATALATALVFVGLANGCMHACMPLHWCSDAMSTSTPIHHTLCTGKRGCAEDCATPCGW